MAVAVIGGLLGGAQGAAAAPGAPGDPESAASRAQDPQGGPAVPPVWPRPQSLKAAGAAVRLGDEATVVAGEDADPHAVEQLIEMLRQAGVHTVHRDLPGRGPAVLLGGSGAQSADAALRALRVPERADLPSGGYRLAVGSVRGRDTIALDGVGEDGLFHAVQTLRQLVKDGSAAGVAVRDWPGTAVRGVTEGFYGQPWSHGQRLSQLDFMGRTKQNRYLYAPGDDPFRQARWREPYPAVQRAEFRALAEQAGRNHVTLAWAVAPGQSMCLSREADVTALKRKIEAMYALGVRAFQLQFQDVSYSEWQCDADGDVFGSGPEAAAKAQARVAGELARHMGERLPQAAPLTVMPTEYHQEGATDYRKAFAAELPPEVQVAWTGVGVVPRTITGREMSDARDVFRHPLVTMDNYPVNDFAQDRIFLGPYTGRDPAVASGSAELLANAMEQASAARIPLFTVADYAWNPRGYRPQESWQAALDDLAGGDARTRQALRALAGNHTSWIVDADDESAYLRPLLQEFWRSRTSRDAAARDRAAGALRDAFTQMREAPQRLRDAEPVAGLGEEVRPWLEKLARYGRAGEIAVDMLHAQGRGDGAAAWRASLELEPLRESLKAQGGPTVGRGVLGPFLDRAEKESAAWTGAERRKESAGRDTVLLGRARPLRTVTTMAEPSAEPGRLEAHVPGEGWRPLGPLSPDGWTQTDAKGLRADGLRVVAPGSGSDGPRVRSLAPWFADEPTAGLDLVRDHADAEIGGAPKRIGVEVTARGPGEVRGSLTAKAPPGIKVTAPEETTVPRGVRATVPVEVSVPADTPPGEYRVPVSFAGQQRTLTVRAYPRTTGPDLAREEGAAASSSGDETPDFPASAAVDGDPETRWSSPAEDAAWWQLRLPRPARVGRVVLHWQDAYAASYRVQTSADGVTWHTAAAITEGRPGRADVRLDSGGPVRFLRVQGDVRGTEFGYSLFSVEAYEVAG
ncbi:beta-N-acetylglucosaminidase domain-containing protein [Streptomyces sp. HNM0663]|uniref:Beta-N-acetylglucosaminidase domain-containing protein n=2 Tax=Streptomyces chengmaiensis TaxID=3040919 RepID=A0ABT6HTC2_9ACTN|nr:beta-N-acetylglucosaminidase domain-containing protein [Streptomyces chengmaiensis]MDH2391546.1 beta-N-acetylglucosaminidase domain-containing protein [Streptomyces chengmaiensis]